MNFIAKSIINNVILIFVHIGKKICNDDLDFLLEKDFSDINLSALYCEKKKTKQVTGSVGLTSY